MKKLSRLNIPIPEEYKERLRSAAEERGISMSQATRQAIALWLYADEEECTARMADLDIEIIRNRKAK